MLFIIFVFRNFASCQKVKWSMNNENYSEGACLIYNFNTLVNIQSKNCSVMYQNLVSSSYIRCHLVACSFLLYEISEKYLFGPASLCDYATKILSLCHAQNMNTKPFHWLGMDVCLRMSRERLVLCFAYLVMATYPSSPPCVLALMNFPPRVMKTQQIGRNVYILPNG